MHLTRIVDSSRLPHAEAPHAETLLGEAGFVHGLARALLRDAELAHDVAQDALLAGLQQPGHVRQWRSWLAAVTRRLAGAAVAERRRRSKHETRAARPEGDDAEGRTAARLRLHRQLCDAVLALPEPYRTAVTLRYLDGLSPRVIARRLGRDVDLVRQHVHRGLVLLRQRLDQDFGDRRSWTAAFATCGLETAGLGVGGSMAILSLIPVLVMKKFVVAAVAVCVLAIGAWWSWRGGGDVASQVVAGPSSTAARTSDAAADGVESPPDVVASAPPTRTELSFTVRVVDEGGQPVAGVTVRCWRAQGEAVVAATGADGRVAFGAVDESGLLRVEAVARPPVLEAVARLVGEREIVLARGAVVSGRMLVDGAPAPTGLRLGLDMPAEELPEGIPAEAARWLEAQAWRPESHTITGDGGAFAFTGLPTDRRVGLRVPRTHWVLPQPGQRGDPDWPSVLFVDAPQQDVVLATTQLQTIHGRVVWDETGDPVREPQVMAYGVFADGSNTPSSGVQGEVDGRFAAGFSPSTPGRLLEWSDPKRRSPLVKADFRVSHPDAAAAVRVDLDDAQLRGEREVVVRLTRAPLLHYRTVDRDDRPIAGARVCQSGGVLGEPTDGDGRGRFGGKAGVVGAPGFLVVPAVPREPASGAIDDPLVFVLEPDNTLRLRLRAADGALPEGTLVELRAAVDLFAGGRMQSELDQRFGSTKAFCGRSGKTRPDGSTAWVESTASMRADASGSITLHSLAAGVAAIAVVQDALRAELTRQAIVLPAPGETLEVDLLVTAKARHLHGRVLDIDGKPLVGADVKVQVGDAYAQFRTDRLGAFDIRTIYGDGALRLTASQSGYAMAEVDGVGRGHDRRAIEFRLQRGHRVHVSVRDANEALVPVHVGVETGIREDLDVQRLALGDYVYSDLPPGRVTFACEFGGQRFTLPHDTANPDAVLRVPTPARIVVSAPDARPQPARELGHLTAQVTRLDQPGEPFEAQLDTGKRRPQRPNLLLPGRYRIELVAQRWQDDRPVRTLLGPAAEVTLRAGEEQRVQLR